VNRDYGDVFLLNNLIRNLGADLGFVIVCSKWGDCIKYLIALIKCPISMTVTTDY
jgi:hypothetical protein